MIDVVRYIQSLLYQHDCVIIPGFGGLVANYESSQIHPASHDCIPSYKSIAFNPNLRKNDGLIVHEIVSNEDLIYADALKAVQRFSDHCREVLSKDERLELPGIGRWRYDIEGKLLFQIDESKNYNIDSFGLPSFKLSPIHREKPIEANSEIEAIVEEPLLEIAEEKIELKEEVEESTLHIHTEEIDELQGNTKKLKTYSLLLAAVFLGMLLISQLIIFGVVPGNIKIQNLGFLEDLILDDRAVEKMEIPIGIIPESLNSSMEEFLLKQIPPLIKVEEEAALKEIEEIKEKEIEEAEAIPEVKGGYYVILGSFKTKAKVGRFMTKLKNKDIESITIKGRNGYTRVGVFSSSDKSTAIVDLDDYRADQNESAWLLKYYPK